MTDFFRKRICDEQLKQYVESFKEGDLVVIEWKHLYGEVRPRGEEPVRPLLRLRKIDEAEAKAL